jgi:hypothetical protein
MNNEFETIKFKNVSIICDKNNKKKFIILFIIIRTVRVLNYLI